jgi:hypothetical protein
MKGENDLLRPIKSVTVIFEDGQVEVHTIPKGTGFYRTEYTWESTNDRKGLGKWDERLTTFEIFWAVKNNVSI